MVPGALPRDSPDQTFCRVSLGVLAVDPACVRDHAAIAADSCASRLADARLAEGKRRDDCGYLSACDGVRPDAGDAQCGGIPMLKHLYPYWRPARRDTIVGMTILVLAGLLELLQPWPIKWLVDYVFGGRPVPPALARLGLSPGDTGAGWAIAWVCAAILVLGVAYKAAQLLSQYLLIRAGLLLVKNLRCHVADHLHRLSLRYHDRAKVGDLIYRAAYDSYAAQSLLSGV